jgi:hypothetical protein
MNTPADTAQLLDKLRKLALAIAGVGLLGAAGSAATNVSEFQRALAIAFTYWTALSVGCVGVLMIHHLTGGSWGFTIQRIMEAGTRSLLWLWLPFLAVMLTLGMAHVYPWADPHVAEHGLVHEKILFLNQGRYWVFFAIYFGIWNGLALALTSWSHKLDSTKDARWGLKMRAISGPGLLVVALTGTFCAVDFLMSTDPEWYSSIYVVQFLVGCILAALAFGVLMTSLMVRTAGWRDKVSKETLRRLGTLMLAFAILWAYMAFSQFLIIWMGDLPADIEFYAVRGHTSWSTWTVVLVVIHIIIPFFVLMSQHTKKNPAILIAMASLLLVARWVDMEWLVTPNLHKEGLFFHWGDVFVWLALGGVWLFVTMSRLASRPLMPLGDPRFHAEESHHG